MSIEMKTLLALEPRILFDGAALVTGAEVVQDQTTQDHTTQDHAQPQHDTQTGAETSSEPLSETDDFHLALSTLSAPSDRREIVFIDTRVQNYHTLLNGIDPNVEAVLLNPTRDGVEQIAEALNGRTDIDAIHFIAEGNEAELHLGTSFLTQESISGRYADLFAQIGTSLTANADLLIYGCNFGQGDAGLGAMKTLAELTGADIAASTDRTGHTSEYADWDLEVSTGFIETSIIIGQATQDAWEGVLATYTVTTTTDGGAGSLRQAIINANANSGTDTITFVGSGTYLLTIAGTGENAASTGDLDITESLTITGNGVGTTVIDGGGIERIFDVRSSSVVTISGLTIQGGNSPRGGGINVDSGTNVTLSNVIVSGNTTSDDGGGIYNAGTLTLRDTAISGNSAVWGGAIYNTNTMILDRVTIDGNMSSNNGGGIYNFGGSSVSLTNVTVSGNTSGGNGGGIFTNRSINITNSTIASNLGGRGIHTVGQGDAVLKNTILDNNVGGNANRALTSAGNNIDSDGTAGLGDPLDGFDPMLGALADNGGPTRTHALLAGSPALNAGTSTGAPTVDQRGYTRLATPDIGAFEYGAIPAVFVVDTTNDVVDGDTSSIVALVSNKGADGFISLREAILAVNAGAGGETIVLQAGTYRLSIAGTGEDAAATGDLDILKNMTIAGVGAGTTIIDANGIDRVFQVRSGSSLTMSDLTIQGGDAALSSGGGLLVSAGGSGNSATLTNVILTGNTAGDGGGISNKGTLNLTDVTIDNNTSTGSGAGLSIFGTTTLTRTTVSNNTNTGSNGGGIDVNTGSLNATNVTISGNSTVSNGGGIYVNNPVTLQNVTVTNNSAAIGSGVDVKPSGSVTLRNTIIAGNTGSADIFGAFTTQNNNLIGDKGTATGLVNGVNGDQVGTGGSPINPLLGALADNGGATQTHALLGGSPAINAGTATGAPIVDQRGVVRDLSVDIGAFEATVNLTPTVDLDANDSSGATGNDYAFTFTEGDPPTAIADSDTDLVDADSVTFAYVKLNFIGLLDGNAEVLVLDGSTFALATAVGSQNTLGGNYHVVLATGGGSATVTITKQGGGTFTEAETETLIKAIQYQHTNTGNPTNGNRLIDVIVNDGSSDSAAARTTINVNPVNDPPIAVADSFTVNEVSTNILNLASNDSDVDDGLDLTSITIIAGPTNGTIDSINADGTVTYTHNGLENLSDSFTYTIDDLTGVTSNTVTVTLTVTPVNDPPSFTGLDNTPTFTEGGAAVVLDSNATIADPELDAANNYNGATLTLVRNGGANANDLFAGSGTLNTLTQSGSLVVGGITIGTVTTNSGGTLVLTFNGNATTALLNSALQQITYANSNSAPPTNVQIDFTINDGNAGAQGSGGALNATESITVTISATNTAPAFTGLDNTPTFLEGGLAVVLDSNATITDPELDAANNYNGASLTLVRNGGTNADDQFAGSGTLLPLVQSGPLVVGGTTIGTVTTNSGGTLVLSFNGNATTALVNGALQQITYANSNGTPPATVQIDFTIDDGNAGAQGSGGALNGTGSITISITALNTPPIAVADGFTVNEGSTNNLNLAGNDSDLDDGLDLTSITIVTGPANGTITSINANGTVDYTHNGSETLSDSFTYSIKDVAGNTSNTVTVSLIITPQNDPPIITSNGGGASANVSVITGSTAVTDVDATDAESTPLTYNIIGGADAALFSIDPTTGVLTFITAPDFQTPGDVGGDNIYDVIVQASDGTAVDTQALAVTVTQANVPPPIFNPPPSNSPPSSDPPPREIGGEPSEDQAPVNGGSIDPSSPGNVPDGGRGSATNDHRESDTGNTLGKHELPAKQQDGERTGILELMSDMWNLLRKPIDITAFKDEIRSLLTRSGFLQDLDRVRDDVQDVTATEKTYVASSIAVSTGLSIGYVIWLLRSGVLLTALLSSVPAWQFVNPLLVLDAAAKKKRKKGQEDVEDDSVESLFEKPSAAADTTDETKDGLIPKTRKFLQPRRTDI